MGLDMFLSGIIYISEHDKEPKVVTVSPDVTKGYRIKDVIIELIYWRKANQIHKWFVDNVQGGEDNCAEYYVDEEQLQELYHAICLVVSDHSLAEELLPVQEGFFFGDTNYNENYFEDLEETKEELEKLFSSGVLEHMWVKYSSSW